MIVADVNVLVYAHREDAEEHLRYRDWLRDALAGGDQAFGVSGHILAGFVRIVTHPRVFVDPTPLPIALAFADAIHTSPNAVAIAPGTRHWGIFDRLCRRADARGNLVADAYLAALALEHGCEWITTDRDYSRFPELRWSHPLRPA